MTQAVRLSNDAAGFEVTFVNGAIYLDVEPWNGKEAFSVRLGREDAIQLAAGLMVAVVNVGEG